MLTPAVKNGEWFDKEKIWVSRVLEDNLVREYGKPSLQEESASNEYDKFISQNLNVLAYAGVLQSTRKGQKRLYRLAENDLLARIARSEDEARAFLIAYLEWTLKEFNWWANMQDYIDGPQTAEKMEQLKKNFTALMTQTTGIGGRSSSKPSVEANRVFAKVMNPLAYQYLVPGIEKGKISKTVPSRYELTYNRPNFRDAATGKPKRYTRKTYAESMAAEALEVDYKNVMTKTKKSVRDYHKSISEVSDPTGVKASHVHHIFPASNYKGLANLKENLIVLTPGQHLGEAHPGGNTSVVDPVYQRTCLNAKLNSIRISEQRNDGMYSYEKFAYVLETAWQIHKPRESYDGLREAIIYHSS